MADHLVLDDESQIINGMSSIEIINKDDCSDDEGCVSDKEEENVSDRWQTGICGLKAGIAHIYETKEFADIVFIVGNREFLCHRLVLAAGNLEFAKMVYKPAMQKNTDSMQKIIVENVSPIGFEALLSYIYTDKFNADTESNILDAHEAARRFEHAALQEECENLMSDWDITVDNVCQLLDKVKTVAPMRARCFQFVRFNVEDVLGCSGFVKTMPDTLWDMLCGKIFDKVQTVVLIANVLRWASSQFPELKNYECIREILLNPKKPILGYLKIQNLGSAELADIVSRYPGLLTSEEVSSLFLNTYRQGVQPLPDWCQV